MQRLVVERQQHAGVIKQQIARVGRLHLASGLFEQRSAGGRLQTLHLQADRRLCSMHLLGGLREAAVVGDGNEGLQERQIQMPHNAFIMHMYAI